MQPGPVLAVETRGGRVQAVHTGHAVVLGEDGQVRMAWGDPGTETYWRSAAKPFQALPFAAVAQGLGLGDREVAVACGSHQAEAFHLQGVQAILDAAGCTRDDLRCGIHDPGPQAVARPAGGWTALHNNCSGKHAGMLAVCRQRGLPLDSYLDPAHPLQGEIRDVVARASGAQQVPVAIDGCGLPTYYLSLGQLARAFQWLHTSGDSRATRVLDAMGLAPEMVGGTGNADTDLARAMAGRIVSKYGALGVVAAVNRVNQEAVAVKLAAGGAQAARAVALAAMVEAGWFKPESLEGPLREHLQPTLRNHAGARVGRLDAKLGQS